MPYKNISELPNSVRDHVPKHGQEIYRAAFNSAWNVYGHDEERAHRVAWAAIKDIFEKDEKSGDWNKKKFA